MRIRIVLAVALWLLASTVAAGEPPSKILLVGNSFTFYNNGIHNHLRQMLRESEPDEEPPFRIRSLTLSGARLDEHRAGLESALQNADWDVVVLQGHSLEAFNPGRVPGFLAATDSLSKLIRASGAEPVLFMTWAYDGQPEMLATIEQNYRRAANANDARLIPVGKAFEAALASMPEVKLVVADRKHPSLEGTYLAACTFYATLMGKSAEPLNYTAGLNPELADELCRVAWQTVDQHQDEP